MPGPTRSRRTSDSAFGPTTGEYQLPGSILKYFGIHEVRLLSNNPDKINALERAGIRVVERVPCQVGAHRDHRRLPSHQKREAGPPALNV